MNYFNRDIELVNNAIKHLELSKHNRCFSMLDAFFEEITKEDPVYEHTNELGNIKTRYNRLQKERRTISYAEYDVISSQIEEDLRAFCNTLIAACKEYSGSNKTVKKTHQGHTLNIFLVIDDDFGSFNEKKAQKILDSLRTVLNVEEETFKYLFIKKGSVIIGVRAIQGYMMLLLKLKSLLKLNIETSFRLLSVRSDDETFERLCDQLLNIQLYLANANLSHAELLGADLSGADLSGTNLSGANLFEADLSEANLSEADLSKATLSGANLSEAKLFGAKLSGAGLSDATLYKVNLSGANLSGADVSKVRLFGANLSGADLSKATLRGANLLEADLFSAKLSRADVSGVTLCSANLSEADLSGANLFGADLSGAYLSGTHLSEVTLIEAKFQVIKLLQAKLNRTKFHSNDSDRLSKAGIDLTLCEFVHERDDRESLILHKNNKTMNNMNKTDQTDQNNKVFLAYAREDEVYVKRLHKILEENGFDPWMDQRNLDPGSDWLKIADEAIKNARFFLACFSRKSVEKAGYFHRELKIALGEFEKKPPDTFYFIPLFIEDVELPNVRVGTVYLKDIHAIEVFNDEGIQKLIQFLKTQIMPDAVHPEAYEVVKGLDRGELQKLTDQLRALISKFPEVMPPDEKPEEKENWKKTIKDYIDQGRIDMAVKSLKEYVEARHPDWESDASQLSARYNTLQRDLNNGIITHEQYQLQKNKITHAILDLIGRLE